jgi:AcrR family transcriptional regulator
MSITDHTIDGPDNTAPGASSSAASGLLPATTRRKMGRRPGDSGTREYIAFAARRQFSEGGYHRTTIRSIATEAEVNPSLVIHYFGSKERLFREVVDLPFDPDMLIASIVEGPIEDRGARFARFVVDLLKDPQYGTAFTAMIRAASSDPQAASLFSERITRGVFLPLAHKLEMDRPETRAAIAATQTIGFVLGRHILKLAALTALSDDEIVALLGPTLQRYLAMPL